MQEEIPFGAWLRKQRRSLDLSRKAFADQIGCAQITLRRIEAGTLKPSEELANILLDKLGIGETERPQWVRFARGQSNIPKESIQEFFPFRPTTNLPTRLTTFIGRETEKEEIINLIGKNRLVTLVGTGGIGKTRLSLQVGTQLLNDYPHGVWFAPFDSLSDPDLVLSTVAAIFDIKEGADRPVLEGLLSALREKSTLLILDNCEHLLGACAQLVATLLTNCPNVEILATSREALGVEGEVPYTIPSLAIPEKNHSKSLKELTQYESVILFTERAALTLPSFNLTDDKAAPVVDICRTLDGIPLAIELAAARVDILQVHEILEQLKHCLDLLISRSRTIQPKHQTMRASLDWSWGLLTEDEQLFLQQLSVFAGGCTLGSAQAVCDGDALNLISALVKKSLILVNQVSSRETRYRFHEIVRQYMRQKLVESGGESDVQTRHLQYFLGLSEQAESALMGSSQTEWHLLLKNERDNIRAALEWAEVTNVEAGLYLSGRLRRFWENFDVREGARWLAGFLQMLESKSYPLARAKALCAQSRLIFWAQEFDLAYMDAQESLHLYRTCGDKVGEIDALLALGLTDFKAPTEKIIELFKQALILSQSIEDPWRQAYALAHLGGYNNNLSQVEEAAALFEQIGDSESALEGMLHLVRDNMLNGDLKSAQKWLDRAAKVGHKLNNRFLDADIFHYYGRIALIKGDYRGARDDLQEALEIARALGHQMSSLWNKVHLGYVALREGNLKEAYEIFSKSAQEFQKDKSETGVVFTLEGMASLYVEVGKLEQAARLIGWADATRKQFHDHRPFIEQTDVDNIIAACLAKMGEVSFSDAYDEGQRMTLNEAVSHALKI